MRTRLGGIGLVLVVTGVAAAAALGQGSRVDALRLVPVASGLTSPLFVAAAPGEPGRLYIVEQGGTIRVLEEGRVRGEPFLDVRDRVVSGGEQGLLGLAFDPRYATNRRFYVDYTDTGGDTRVVAFRSDGTRAIPSSAQELLHVAQPFPNHNGGMLAFGPDGALYVGMGDGGSAGDPGNRAQSTGTLLGKLVRLDPAGRRPPRIAALGLRNPWRFSFDRETGDLYIGDVGQDRIEEIDYTPRARLGGTQNYGWDAFEGTAPFEQKPLGPGRLTTPIAQYAHGPACSVTGGYVYRGSAVPAARGRYFYGDFCSGAVWSLKVTKGRAGRVRSEPFTVRSLSSFGEDGQGELYLVSLEGSIYRLSR